MGLSAWGEVLGHKGVLGLHPDEPMFFPAVERWFCCQREEVAGVGPFELFAFLIVHLDNSESGRLHA